MGLLVKRLFILVFLTLAIWITYHAIALTWAAANVQTLLQQAAPLTSSRSLSKEQLEIVLRIEDPRFYKHFGLDISNGQGMTTITSNLARDIFLYQHSLEGVSGLFQRFYRAVFDCCKKIDMGRDMMALVLHKHMSKEDQLERYTHQMYMGQKPEGGAIIGFFSAARTYFSKDLAQLERAEFIKLVALLKSPGNFHPGKNKRALDERARKIEKIIDGACAPDGFFDTSYAHC